MFKAIDNVKYWSYPEWLPSDMASKFASLKIAPEPRGVTLIIGPWNYPITCLLRPLISAIAAGCTAVLKPSEVAINTCRLLLVLY